MKSWVELFLIILWTVMGVVDLIKGVTDHNFLWIGIGCVELFLALLFCYLYEDK